MIVEPMNAALAGRMAVWCLLILAGMVGLAVLVGSYLGDVSESYPPMDEALDSYSESDDAQDYEEGSEPPRAA